jgi:hypothetical protein
MDTGRRFDPRLLFEANRSFEWLFACRSAYVARRNASRDAPVGGASIAPPSAPCWRLAHGDEGCGQSLGALAQESRLTVFRMLVEAGPDGLTPSQAT